MKMYTLKDNCGNHIKAMNLTTIYEAMISFEKKADKKYEATVSTVETDNTNDTKALLSQVKDLIGMYQKFQDDYQSFMDDSHKILSNLQTKLLKSCQQD